MRYDLHSHSTASDGFYSPHELVTQAKKADLNGFALTDHDTVKGVAPALAAAAEIGLELIPGIELSIQVNGRDIHVLGYFIDHGNPGLQSTLDEIVAMRAERAREMVKRVQDMGYDLDYEDVREQVRKGAPGRPHVARAMVKRGVVGNLEEAFARFIGDDGPAFVPKSLMDMDRGFNLLNCHGAVPVLAHPMLCDYESFLPDFLARGLQGLEVDHPKHDLTAMAKLRSLCRKHDLVATGGSDFHVPGIASRALGSFGVSGETLAELKARAGRG